MKIFTFLFTLFLISTLFLTWCTTQKDDISDNTSYCESWSSCNIENSNSDNQNIDTTNYEKINKDVSTEPMMKKMVVDENMTPEEFEKEMTNTCANASWIRKDWECTLEDGSKIMF